MANNLRVFNTNSEYQSADLVHPAVSYVIETDKVIYEPTPSFQGKWKATYSNGSVTSAECGSSSEITQNEINTSNLVSVEIGDCVTSIGNSAFIRCIYLTSIDIPSGVTSIGPSAFQDCYSLTSIDIPNSVTSIGEVAFNYCSLTSVTIGSGVTSIGDNAFNRCTSLTSITVNAIVPPTLEFAAFDNTNNCPIYVPCESVEAYKSASGWSDYASRITCVQPPFEGKFKATYSDGREYDLACDGNTTLTTGNTRTNDYTLSAMTEAIIGDYCVTSIGDYAFKGCVSLTSATIGSGVTSIGQEAFTMTKITSLTLPNSITNIKGWAFYGCSGLTSITVEAITPPTLGNSAFNNSTCPIYVPSQSVQTYKTTSGWNMYASRIQAIP